MQCAGREVWQDIHPDSQDFIRSYLHQYPEVEMCSVVIFSLVLVIKEIVADLAGLISKHVCYNKLMHQFS